MSLVPRSQEAELDQLREALEAAGRRFTRQRVEVYRSLRDAGRHPTAEDVYSSVRGVLPNISLATVYKALDALVESGVADKLPTQGGSARFDARRDGHYHLRCTRSGRVEDLPTPFDPNLLDKLDPTLTRHLERSGFELTGYRLELVGYFREALDSGAVEDEES